MRALAVAGFVAALASLAACQSTPSGPSAGGQGKSAALRNMEQVAIAAHRCWFAANDPAFRAYSFANELMYEVLKSLHADLRLLKDGQREIKQELISIRGQLIAMNQDIHNIYGILGRHDERLDRIEKRLELHEFAEPHTPYRSE